MTPQLTSAYKVKLALQQPDEDWTAQLNIQRYILEMNEIDIDKLYIGAMVRDWTPYKHKTEAGYPDQIEYIPIQVWPMAKTANYIIERINAMAEAEPCSQKERWQDDPTYALMKVGGSRAVKTENSLIAIQKYAEEKKLGAFVKEDEGMVVFMMVSKEHYIEIREAPARRCEGYCSVNKWCEWYQSRYMSAEDGPFK